jgi:8-oxo-dGTP pyrophosphatase MutT (NUDIX family)
MESKMSLKEEDFVIDGAIATAAIDSSGETMDIEGCDISSLPKDGLLNFEHKNSENGGSFVSIIGKCIKAKKIFTESDCENGRERMYWNDIKLPFIYGVFRLFKNHPNAEAAMAIMRDQAEHREPQILRFSIEGSTIERKGNTLVHTLARNVALTQKPCNKTAISGILSDPSNPKEKDELAEILKEDIEKFASQGKEMLSDVSWTYVPFSDTEDKIDLTPEINKIKKSLSSLAKAYTGVPGAQTGLDSLAVENVTFRNRVKKAILDYDKKKHGKFRDYAKIQLPEASDEFLDRFSSLADDLVIKGGALRKDEGTKTPKEIVEDIYDGRIKDAKVIDDLLSREDVGLEMVSSRPNSEYSVKVAKITNSPKVMNEIIGTKNFSQLASHLLVREDLPKETRDTLINSAVKFGELNNLVFNKVSIPETTQRLVISRGDEDDIYILSQAPNLHEDVIRHLSGLDNYRIDSNLVQSQDNLPDDIQEKFASESPTSYKMVSRKNLSENARRILFNKDNSLILEKMYQRPDLTPEEVRSGLSHPLVVVRSIAAKHPNISKQDREKIIDGSTSLGKDEHGAVLGLAKRKDLSDEEFKSLVNRSEYLDDALSSRPNLNPQHLHLLSQSKSLDTLDMVSNHPQTGEATLRGLLSNPHPGIVTIAKEKLAYHDPDSIHNESVNVKMGVSKLRKLRDIIQGQGRSEAHPKELPAGDWNKARLPNGNISADKLQQIIDLQPGVKYNISHGEWSGVQRHNDEHSKVFQLNLSTDTVNKLKAAGPGVYDTFRKMHEDAKNDQHPTGKGGLGWVRYTGNPKDGIFIDEVQSDLGQSFVKQAANQAKQKQQQEQGQQQEQIQFPEEHYQKIKDIVFQGKHPNEVLHEAFQEYLRTNKKAIGSDIHVWSPESKASISLSDEGGKIPGHMQITYGDIPKKMGMEPKTYGELFTQDNYDYEREKKATFGDIIRKSSIRSQKCVFIWCEDWAGNVLWGKRHDGKYSLPGGHVNESEDFHIAAVRELQEETNVVPDVMTEIGIAHGGKYNEVLIYIYKAIGRGDPTSQFDPDREFSDVFWVDCRSGIPIEIMRNLAHPRNVVLELLGYQQPDIFTKSQKDPEVSSIDPYHVPKYENHGIKDLHNHWQVTENEHHLDHPKNKYLLRTIGKSIAKMIGAANPEGHEGVRVDPNLPDPTTKAYYDEGYSYVSPQDAINISKTFSKSDENKLQHGHSIKALLHEVLHGASEKHRYEEGSSKALEEASTEILANHYTPQVMAHSAGVAVPKSPPMFSADKEGVFPTYSTAYMGWCSKLAQVVGCIEGLDKPGINEEEHAKKLTDAVVHYSYKLKKTPNREDFLIKSLLKKRLNLDPPSTEDKNHPYFKAYNSLANQLFGLNSLPVGGKMAGGMFHRSKTLTRRKIHIILDNARKAYNKEWV